MKRLTIICTSCQNSMVTIEKKEFVLSDYIITEEINGEILIKSVFTCICGENVIPTENDITNID